MGRVPTLAEFGHRTMTVNGRPAEGGRRLLIVLVDYDEFPSITAAHPVEYYQLLGFGDPSPPFSTDPVNPVSMREYFRENSNGRFWFDPAGPVIGPIAMGALGVDPGPEARCGAILARVAELAPEVFPESDSSGNLVLGADELSVLLVENFTYAKPGMAIPAPFTVEFAAHGILLTVTVSVLVGGGGPFTPWYQLAHELSHVGLGTVDMYNSGAGNYGLTLMSGYSFTSNDQYTVHLDAWHKLLLGWAEPQLFELTGTAGSAVVSEAADGSVLLWDARRGTTEYFLIERRRNNAPGRRFDCNFVGDGVLIWRVQRQTGEAFHLGAPALIPGGSNVWAAGTTTPTLQFSDGASASIVIDVGVAADGAMHVSWRRPSRFGFELDAANVVSTAVDADPTQAERAAIIEELNALARIEHALCVENLLIHCALGHDLSPANGETHGRVHAAAGAAFFQAQHEMRHLHQINNALLAAGAGSEMGRAGSLVVDGAPMALLPANPAADPDFLARGRRLAATVDGRWAALALRVGAAIDAFDADAAQQIAFVLEFPPDHATAFTAISEPLEGLAPTDYLRATRVHATSAIERRLIGLSDEYYRAVVATVAVWFAEDAELGGVLRGRALTLMDMLNEINGLLVARGLLPPFRLHPSAIGGLSPDGCSRSGATTG